MKNILFTIYLLFIVNALFSQDYILTKSGKRLEVKITSEDSLNYYFPMTSINNEIKTQFPKSEVKEVIYGNTSKNIVVNKITYIDTVNLINHDFVYLYSGKLIESGKVEYKDPFLSSSYIIVDTVKYKPSSIKFFKNTTGYFANINQFMPFGEEGFAKRITTGRINIFEYSSTYYTPMYSGSSAGYGGGGLVMVGGGSSKIVNCYNKGFSDVKEVNYENLVLDLRDNTESIHYLEKYHNASIAKLGLGIAGTVLIAAGSIVIANQVNAVNKGETDAQQNYGITYSLFGAGLACYGIGIVFHFKKGENLDLAIKSYNK